MSPTGSQDGTFFQDPTPLPLPYRAGATAQWETGDSDVKKTTLVAYTHRPSTPDFLNHTSSLCDSENIVICSNFDDLLDLLEVDAVAEIVFDSSVSSHEVNYITRWARIFKPSLRGIYSPPASSPSHAAFFSSQQTAPTV
jgi:hypothetical protein